MRNAGLDEAQDGKNIARRSINNLKYADDTTLMACLIPGSGISSGEPPPVFLPRKSHGQKSLAGYSPWGCK